MITTSAAKEKRNLIIKPISLRQYPQFFMNEAVFPEDH